MKEKDYEFIEWVDQQQAEGRFVGDDTEYDTAYQYECFMKEVA